MERIEKIEKFEKVINENKNSMLQIIVLYNMSCNGIYEELTDKEKSDLLGIIYNFYLKDESFSDLAHISDIVINNHKEILKYSNNCNYEEIKTLIYNKL
ncbi:MAG: hypothetical protein HFJ48_01360 [Clostridia bacterium]|nr:hypothetical protein [Clostridia bacterium]